MYVCMHARKYLIYKKIITYTVDTYACTVHVDYDFEQVK